MKHLSVAALVAAGLGAWTVEAARADGPNALQLQATLAAASTTGLTSIDLVARATALGAIQAAGGNASSAIAVAAGETTGRTFAARLSDIYNIADHGAMGDAVSDDIAMNKAIAYATANPGTHILIPDGSWNFAVSAANGFQIPSFTTVEGEDQAATILTWNDTAGDYLFTAASNTGSTRTADIAFQEFTVKGTWGTAAGGMSAYALANAPFIPSGVDGLTFFHVTSEYSRGFGISARNSTAVTVHDSHTRYTDSDAINLSQCSDVSVDNNHIEHTDDDAISVHSDIYDTLGVRRNIDITGNHIIDAQGIDVLAARQANISDNTLDSVRQSAISVTTTQPGSAATEGNSADEAILITGNKVTNLLNRQNIDNVNQGASAIIVNGISARAGGYGAAPGEAVAGTAKVVDPYPEFMGNSQSSTVAVSGGHAIVVEGNLIARTLPASNGSDPRYKSWTDFRQGTITSRLGPQNPTLAESDMQGACVALTGGNLRDVLIQGNDCHGMSDGLTVTGDANSHYADIVYRGNNDVDYTGHGILVNTGGRLGLLAEDNLFDGDPFQKSPARGANGTWANTGGPSGLYRQSGSGVVFRRNTLLNLAMDTNTSTTDPASGYLFEANTDEGDPLNVNSFQTTNKGIGYVHNGGFRQVQLDSDPASATYDTILSVPVPAASSMPTTGKWVQGAYVANATPGATGPSGWLRLTTGSGNAAGTDWLVVCPSCGGVLSTLLQPNAGVAVGSNGLTISPQGALATSQNTQVVGGASLTVGAYPQATLTASQGIGTAQCGQRLWVNASAAVTLTVGSLYSGCEIEVIQQGTAAVTGAAGAGETMLLGGSGANVTAGPGTGFRITVSPNNAVFRISTD